MSYENSPACQMLATYCACCGRPLVDAVSVEIGIGPDCRKKYAFDLPVSEEARKQANVLVHIIAVRQSGDEVVGALNVLRGLGFSKLADRVAKRIMDIRIEVAGDALVVYTPYTDAAVAALRSVPGRRWNKDLRASEVPATQKAALWKALKVAFSGKQASGPKGIFTI